MSLPSACVRVRTRISLRTRVNHPGGTDWFAAAFARVCACATRPVRQSSPPAGRVRPVSDPCQTYAAVPVERHRLALFFFFLYLGYLHVSSVPSTSRVRPSRVRYQLYVGDRVMVFWRVCSSSAPHRHAARPSDRRSDRGQTKLKNFFLIYKTILSWYIYVHYYYYFAAPPNPAQRASRAPSGHRPDDKPGASS